MEQLNKKDELGSTIDTLEKCRDVSRGKVASRNHKYSDVTSRLFSPTAVRLSYCSEVLLAGNLILSEYYLNRQVEMAARRSLKAPAPMLRQICQVRLSKI